MAVTEMFHLGKDFSQYLFVALAINIGPLLIHYGLSFNFEVNSCLFCSSVCMYAVIKL